MLSLHAPPLGSGIQAPRSTRSTVVPVRQNSLLSLPKHWTRLAQASSAMPQPQSQSVSFWLGSEHNQAPGGSRHWVVSPSSRRSARLPPGRPQPTSSQLLVLVLGQSMSKAPQPHSQSSKVPQESLPQVQAAGVSPQPTRMIIFSSAAAWFWPTKRMVVGIRRRRRRRGWRTSGRLGTARAPAKRDTLQAAVQVISITALKQGNTGNDLFLTACVGERSNAATAHLEGMENHACEERSGTNGRRC